MARIVAVGTAVPPYELDAESFRLALVRAFAPHAHDLRSLSRMAERSGVRRRFISLPVDELLRPRSLDESNRVYAETAVQLSEIACRKALGRAGVSAADIGLVVSTSCTGYMLPSLDARLVETLGLSPSVRRLPITELGCLAGAAGIARAADLMQGLGTRAALVVAAEFPSLTFQLHDGSMDNLVSTLVFGDGVGAAVLRADGTAGLEIVASHSLIIPGTLAEMGFDLGGSGFQVVLSKDVPGLLGRPFAEATEALLRAHGLTPQQLAFACIHPGGPKILRAVDETLGIEGLTAPSWNVLEGYGNQSSAAVFFILDRLLQRSMPPDGAYGLLAGFGPGLSLELVLLRQRA